MMESQTFLTQRQILRTYHKKKEASSQPLSFFIIKRERWLFFFEKKTVLFYTYDEIKKKVTKLLYQLIEEEFNLKIKFLTFLFLDKVNLQVKLDAQNKKLLIGNFGQNLKSLNFFLSYTLSNFFKNKFSVKLVFPESNEKKKSNKRNFPKKDEQAS